MKKILPLILFLISGFFSYSYAIDLKKYQLTQVSQEEKIFFDEVKTFLVLKDSENRLIQLVYAGEIKDDVFETLMKLHNSFNAWESLKIESIQFNILKDSMDILILMSSFSYQKKNFLPYLPNGIAFIYTNTKMDYDFRILKETISHKFKGTFENEKAFLEKLLIYIEEDNPEEFIRKQQEDAIAKKEAEEKKLNKKDNFVTNRFMVKFFIGTGSIAGLSFGVNLYDYFEISALGGFIYYKEDEYGKEIKKMAASAGLRLNIYLMHSELFQPYVFGGAQYNFSIQNYDKRAVEFFGVGEVIFKYFFCELSYMLSKNGNDFTFGLGAQLPF